MRFKVPQFLDVEDKLFGPFTFFQFAYLAGGGGIIFILYRLLPIWISIFLIIPVGALSLALVFYRINNKPFIYYLQAGINYYISTKLYIWKQRLVKPGENKETEDIAIPPKVSAIPMMNQSKLEDLSWSLDMESKEKSS
jgi:hypothetical protein